MTLNNRSRCAFFRPALIAMIFCVLLSTSLYGAELPEHPDPVTAGFQWLPDINNANQASSTSALPQASGDDFLVAEGKASYYSRHFHGKKTASGEFFNLNHFTAAHRSLAFGTSVRVINLANGKDVVVRINDRGPFRKGRIIDVSPAAAKKIGLLSTGTANVRIEAYN